MARFNSTQNFMHGEHTVTVQRNENLIAHSLFVILIIGAIIGGIALLLWSYQIGAATGGRFVPPTPVVVTTPPRPPATAAPTVIKVEPIRVAVELKTPPSPPATPPVRSGLPPNAW